MYPGKRLSDYYKEWEAVNNANTEAFYKALE